MDRFECIASQCGTSSAGDCGCASKLRAEIERLTAERDLWKERTEEGSRIIMANVAEIELLRAALSDCIHGRRDWMEKAKAALARKEE